MANPPSNRRLVVGASSPAAVHKGAVDTRADAAPCLVADAVELSADIVSGELASARRASRHARDDEKWMALALSQADIAAAKGEVPVGCVIVDAAGRAVGTAHNERETFADPTAHAEIAAIREAAARLLSWRLDGASAYVTLEPCAMCAGALVLARVARVVYGCADPKGGAIDTMFHIGRDAGLNHRFEVEAGVLEKECAERLRRFFAALRGGSAQGPLP
jgi:tRNA(adenine34) deaminase